ncbi:hypothetical protein B0A48_02888 [Cryoendolithus antarcticus]|uniref:AB hydrolase-1 domain-containing protein n=1 Tax=Cryoendolithus antarcticus TaxID=1507870 RepID=A0A1V8TLJ2_9PEZI|nr:hypothetical protein B0A48_02888 [Cryoendolithus antarcticus]
MESMTVKTPDGIAWYVERFSPSDKTTPAKDATPIVLIPSGEGDCGNLREVGTLLAASGRHALSFDMPGFSRTTAPKEAYTPTTPEGVARQIVGLLDTLQLDRAAFFGSSSGGGAVLAILALHPERAKCGIVHEVPLGPFPGFDEIQRKSDDEVSSICGQFFANVFIEQEENNGKAKWDALGPEYRSRLSRNYVTWMRVIVNGYETATGELATVENLKKRPIFWTVGGMSDSKIWQQDFDVAGKAGIQVRTDVLHCMHFPYVSIPEKTADWIIECVEQA